MSLLDGFLRTKKSFSDEALNELYDQVQKHIGEYLKAKTPLEAHAIVEKYPDLLLEENDGIFETLKNSKDGNAGTREFFTMKHNQLKRCRKYGVRRAFEEYIAVVALVDAEDFDQARRVLENRKAALLSSSADDVLMEMKDEMPEYRESIEQWRLLLSRCREVGIERAWQEYS
jgi:hypothetical protein